MNRSESKYFNTAVLMDKALIMLLEKKSLEFITVKEICRKAGVNRSTFYLHYESVDDLLRETNEYILREFLSSFEMSPDSLIKKIESGSLSELILISEEYLRPYLSFVKDNRYVFKAAFNNPSCLKTDDMFSGIKKHILFPIFKRFQIPENMHKYRCAYYMSGTTAIVKEWLDGGCKESVEFIEKVLTECVLSSGDLLNDKSAVASYKESGE